MYANRVETAQAFIKTIEIEQRRDEMNEREALWIVDEYLRGEDNYGVSKALKLLSERSDFDKLPHDVKCLAAEMYHEGCFEISFIHGPY